MESPFINDPFAMVWMAYKKLYDKPCEVAFDSKEFYGEDAGYGVTIFPDDGSAPQVAIFTEFPIVEQVEVLAHELAHVAVGIEHDHDDVWKDAFDAIFEEYNAIGNSMFLPEECEVIPDDNE